MYKDEILELKICELQFRLACCIRLSSELGDLKLTTPTTWSHGEHVIDYEDMFLNPDQVDIATYYLRQSAVYLLTLAMKENLQNVFSDPRNHTNPDVVSAYEVSRLIRNAFAHSPVRPVWLIDTICKDRNFVVQDVIKLNTQGLDGQAFDWRHYGGPLALLKLSKFIRLSLLGDTDTGKDRNIEIPDGMILQQGDLILRSLNPQSDSDKEETDFVK